MAVVKNRALRVVLLVLGFTFLGIAFIGIAIPGLPTTGPVLLAAFLFSKSSERFDNWLVTNRLFGTIVQDWRAGRGFSVRGKAIAVAAIVVSFGITTIFFVDNIYARVTLWLLALGIADIHRHQADEAGRRSRRGRSGTGPRLAVHLLLTDSRKVLRHQRIGTIGVVGGKSIVVTYRTQCDLARSHDGQLRAS